MKTIRDMYKEVIASEELKREFLEAVKDEENGPKNVKRFLKKYGCEPTRNELMSFFEEKSGAELDEGELEVVVGGNGIWAEIIQLFRNAESTGR
ncbi:MAG: hypothetical protein K5696_11250 [Lachnospiraceae bacterium]|nr:hypothetical protein [Lachnospiraceae bacterium]